MGNVHLQMYRVGYSGKKMSLSVEKITKSLQICQENVDFFRDALFRVDRSRVGYSGKTKEPIC